jgi:hypothetical protein
MTMKELSADSWKRQGSSIIWDKDSLQALLPAASLVSLRQFPSWQDAWPTAHRYEVAMLPDQLDLAGPLVGNQRRQNELSIGRKLDIEPVPRLDWREDNPSFGIG